MTPTTKAFFENIDRKRDMDSIYWQTPLLERIYLRLLYAIGAFSFVALFVQRIPSIEVQFVICLIVGLIVLFYRLILPNGLQITERFKAVEMQAREELNAGNFDGVPQSLLKASGITDDQMKRAKEAQQVAKIIEQRQMKNRQTVSGAGKVVKMERSDKNNKNGNGSNSKTK